MSKALRDISEMPCQCQCQYLQKKISLAGEMKTAIKRALDSSFELKQLGEKGLPISLGRYSVDSKRIRELRKAMENYLNCES